MKKIKPKDQTRAISRAKWEFIQRNPKKKEAFEIEMASFRAFYEKLRAEELAKLEAYPDMRKTWENLGREPMPPCDEFLREGIQRAAADAYYPWVEFFHENIERFLEGFSDHEINVKMREILNRKAENIFDDLTHGEPLHTLLIGVDMRRTKQTIMAEVEALLDEYQGFYRGNDHIRTREKWLSIADELLEVWDLYEVAGKIPALQTFTRIARKVKRPVSTVKDQWRLAYEKINGKPYNPESKYTTEEREGEATELCARCPHGAKCYKRGDWYPCTDYLSVVGKERSLKLVEYRDDLLQI